MKTASSQMRDHWLVADEGPLDGVVIVVVPGEDGDGIATMVEADKGEVVESEFDASLAVDEAEDGVMDAEEGLLDERRESGRGVIGIGKRSLTRSLMSMAGENELGLEVGE